MDKIRRQLSLLITLAKSDGNFHEKEKAVIERLAMANHFPDEELKALILEPDGLDDLTDVAYEDKFDYLYNVIMLMKVDNVILDSELLFCQKIANSLGFKLSAFMELYPHVHVNMKDHEQLKMLKKKLQNLLLA